MEPNPNHLPSSPLQSHRHPSSRSTNPPPPSPSGSEFNKLNLPTSLQQPQNGNTPTTTTTLSRQEVEPAPSYLDDSQWYSASPSSQLDSSRTQPVASTSRCPTPQLPEPLSAAHSSSLLTSEPLNRSASAVIHPFTRPVKRQRASSLPLAAPDVKRLKARHDPHTPSETRTYALKLPRRERTRLEKAEEAAALSFRRTIRPPTIVASRLPPINVSTLKSLDANDILKNPQLRHDLLFDALAFRPVSSSSQDQIVSSGSYQPVADAQASAILADMYWESIADEITSGCRCTRWFVDCPVQHVDGKHLLSKVKEQSCVCGGWKSELSDRAWWSSQKHPWPSRLPALIKTLREILISLMGSTTPCANHFAHSFSREALEAHEATCPTITHALVPELYSALDPEFLTSQVRWKVFNLNIFQMLGEAMKVHCAPVRDAMVDDMVQTAVSGDVALGLRKCFDCVEIMKLDIANHQVHALRPYLWKAAAAHELNAFRNVLAKNHTTTQTSATRGWIRSASMRVLSSTHPEDRAVLLDCRSDLVLQSTSEGFLGLIFADWSESSWPPVVQRRMSGPASIQLAESSTSTKVIVPESLKMDSRRIKNFHAEVVDLAITQMVIAVFQGFLLQAHPDLSKRDLKRYLESARNDINFALECASSWSAILPGDDVSDLAIRLATRSIIPDLIVSDKPRVASHQELARIHTIARAFDTYFASSIRSDSKAFHAALKQNRQVVSLILDNSLFASRSEARQREGDDDDEDDSDDEEEQDAMDMDVDEDEASASTSKPYRLSNPALHRAKREAKMFRAKEEEDNMIERLGMSAIATEIRDLVARMARIVSFNLKVFEEVYSESGMVVGS